MSKSVVYALLEARQQQLLTIYTLHMSIYGCANICFEYGVHINIPPLIAVCLNMRVAVTLKSAV